MDVPRSICQCPAALIRVGGYGTGRKLNIPVALAAARLKVIWVVTL
jgi:hypothetical protein